MDKPVELLQRIQFIMSNQMLIRKRLENAKLKIDRDIIARELNESCEYMQKLDQQLTDKINAEKKTLAIIFENRMAS